MNPYSLPPLISSILFLLIGGFCFLKNRKSVVNLTFSLLSIPLVLPANFLCGTPPATNRGEVKGRGE